MILNNLQKYIETENINNFLIQESFKEFIVLSLTDDELEKWAKEYGDWFNRGYETIKKKNKDSKGEFVIKNLFLFNHLSYSQTENPTKWKFE